MIYTVTMNPSLDYVVSVPDFQIGLTNRTETEGLVPGGKGINVSILLSHLGIKNTALGFVAGFTGDEIVRRLEQYGIHTDFVKVMDGNSRINVKLKSIDGTEINGMGPKIQEQELGKLMQQLYQLQAGDCLVLAGSIPTTVSKDIYRSILENTKEKELLTVVDATGDLLLGVLKYHPFLIKPNHHELGELFGVNLKTREDVIPYAKKLQEKGARNVVVSLAGEGAVLVAEDGTVESVPAPKGTLVNAVGSGDSMVAGFLAGWLEEKDYRHAFYLGVAAGSASAFSENLATKEEILHVYRNAFTASNYV